MVLDFPPVIIRVLGVCVHISQYHLLLSCSCCYFSILQRKWNSLWQRIVFWYIWFVKRCWNQTIGMIFFTRRCSGSNINVICYEPNFIVSKQHYVLYISVLFKLLMLVCIFVVHNFYQLLPWFYWSSFGLCNWYVNQWDHPESDNYVSEASCQGREKGEVEEEKEDPSWVAFLQYKSPYRCCKWAALQFNLC